MEEEMRKSAIRYVALIVATFAVASCTPTPVYNVESAPMSTSPAATLEQVTKSIKRAGDGLGWQMSDVKSGQIEGQLFLRNHIAIVDIVFDTKAFSIRYKDSTNLKYDGTNIHKNYNNWVTYLERAILAQTSLE